jgi:hypothetical protein
MGHPDRPVSRRSPQDVDLLRHYLAGRARPVGHHPRPAVRQLLGVRPVCPGEGTQARFHLAPSTARPEGVAGSVARRDGPWSGTIGSDALSDSLEWFRGVETMALLTVEGIYRDGKIELSERPESVEATARVLVTFLPAPEAPPVSAVDRETLRLRAIARMREGIHFGGPPYPSREELHERTR